MTLADPIKICYNTTIRSRKERETALRLLYFCPGGPERVKLPCKNSLCLCAAGVGYFTYREGENEKHPIHNKPTLCQWSPAPP